MPIFMNPFQKHDVSDFPDVYVPLAHATRKASVIADPDKKMGFSSDSPMDDRAREASNGAEFIANTIEGLLLEIDEGTLAALAVFFFQTASNMNLDIAASGHDTAYDRT